MSRLSTGRVRSTVILVNAGGFTYVKGMENGVLSTASVNFEYISLIRKSVVMSLYGE